MNRKNDKKQVVSYENSIKKSNELSMAKLNHGLTLNQMQLLAFAIYSTQQDGKTEFNKGDFEKKFNLEKYQTRHAKEDVMRVSSVQFSIEDLENDYFEYWNVFRSIKYDRGRFTFRWNEEFIPHILELKERYITTDLSITSQFRSEFSWTLYEFLKAHYGYWRKPMSKEALMRLFGVEDKKTYQKNTGDFKRAVLDISIAELNQHTEFEVRYKDVRKGRAIVGFELYWTTGENMTGATKKQISELRAIVDAVREDMFDYINLKDDQDRERAIQLVRETEGMRPYTEEPICITKERADELLLFANHNLAELERLLEADRKPKVPLYNWLEDKEY